MGKLFDIDAEVKSIIQDGLDDLITNLGKTCRLVYPATRWEDCSNCIYDPVGHKSSNRWKSGGPIPFPNGTTCPNCNGSYKRPIETTEDILFLCEWEPKKFATPFRGMDIRVPFGMLQTKGFIENWPKVEKCDYMIFDTNLATLGKRIYKLSGEPGDRSNIIQGRYFTCLWERHG